MNGLHRTSSSVVSSPALEGVDKGEVGRPGDAEAPVMPDAPRQGGLPQGPGRGRPSLLRGAILTAATAVLIATSLPVHNGGALAEPAAVQPAVEQVAQARPVRGEIVSAPDASGRDGFWLTPLQGRQVLEVQGQPVQRIWLGAAGSPEATGLQSGLLGDVDLQRASQLKIVATEGGLEAYATFPEGDRVMHATTIGLPREVSGTVRLGAAPNAPGGAQADHLYLHLDEHAAVYLNGQRFTDAVHLGAATDSAVQGLQPGMQADLGARLRAVETEYGPMAQVAAVIDLSTAGHEVGPLDPPFVKEGAFYAADATALPALTLSEDGDRREVLVVDAAAARAYLGGFTDGAFDGFGADYAVTRHLAGGPEFDLTDGAPAREGRALDRLGASDWFRDAKTGEVFRIEIGKDEVARATASFLGPR